MKSFSSVSLAVFAFVVMMLIALGGGCGYQGGWHIVVQRYQSPAQDSLAESVFNIFKTTEGLDSKKAELYRSKDSLVLGYGRYVSFDDDAAQRDLKFIKSLGLAQKGRAFPFARLELVPEPDPPVRSDWLLTNAKGYWSLEIARFDEPGRKKVAVTYLKMLRREGRRAYVWHGRFRSMVCVGAFAETAVRTVGGTSSRDPTRLIVTDLTLKKLKARYPHLLINGEYHTLKGKKPAKTTRAQGGKQQGYRTQSELIRISQPAGSIW